MKNQTDLLARTSMRNILSITILLLIAQFGVNACLAATENETPFKFESSSGETVSAFKGSFQVRENRDHRNSRMIPINYVRFPAIGERAGPPIVYLSGGPGGSGIRTAKNRRFKLFMMMRQFGDVIALDQRGTGQNHTTPDCESNKVVPLDVALSDSEYYAIHQQAFVECLQFWKNQNVDIHGYTTKQSVHDLEELRIHLGADKLSLWGISYGSHLALAALKEMDAQIHKVVIASAEGLDQTIKMPFRTDAYFSRLQNVINQNEETQAKFPDIKALMRRVHKRLEQDPIPVSFERKGQIVNVLLQRLGMQQFAANSISDPKRAWQLLQLYAALDSGNTKPLVNILSRFIDPEKPISFRAMPYAMDLASGQSENRYKEVMRQSETSILASHLNPTIHYNGLIPNIDLGEEFRKAPKSEVPVLLFSGTLDGRTYIDSQQQAISGLVNAVPITVVNGGHNLYKSSPEISETIERFMRGEEIKIDEINVGLRFSSN